MNAAAAATTTVYLELPTPIQTQLHRTSLRLLQAAMRAQLPGNLKLLLHTLCMHHNDQAGCAWPSVERLAKLCSTSTRTVQRNLSELVQRGMVIVGRAPGIRSNAYAVQEERLNTIAIATLQNAPAQPAAAHWLRPTTTFAAPEATPTPPTPDTHVTQTEVNGVELKKTGEEESQAEQAALTTATAQVNTQRQRNGKRPLSRTDTQTMAREAQRAQITPLQALQWVLARASRNFFKADYASGASGASGAGGDVGLGTTQPTGASAQNGGGSRVGDVGLGATASAQNGGGSRRLGCTQPNIPKYPAAPAAPTAPDLDTQALIARQARAQEAKAAQPPAIEPNAAPLTVAGALITGPAWATSAARQFCAGMPVSLFRIQAACSVLGVSRQALRGEVGQVGQAQQQLVV